MVVRYIDIVNLCCAWSSPLYTSKPLELKKCNLGVPSRLGSLVWIQLCEPTF